MSDKTESTTKMKVVTFEQATSLTGNKAVAFFSDEQNILPLIEQVKKEALSLVPDLKTKKGRDAIGTNALNVSKSRKLLEELIDKSVSAMDTKVRKAKAVKKVVISELKDVRETVLAPRNQWQKEQDEIEQKRIDAIKAKIANISTIGLFTQDETTDQLSQKIDALENIDVSDSFEEFTADAAKAISEAISSLNARILFVIEEKKANDQRIQLLAEQKKTRIQERLSNLVQIPLGLMGKHSTEIKKKINSLNNFEIKEDDFDERCTEATTSLAQVVSQLDMMFNQAEQMEAMQAEQKAIAEHAEAIQINAEFDEFKARSKQVDTVPNQEQTKVFADAVNTGTGCIHGGNRIAPEEISKKPIVSQLQKNINAIEAQATHVPPHVDFLNWARDYSIDSNAFLALEKLINKHFS